MSWTMSGSGGSDAAKEKKPQLGDAELDQIVDFLDLPFAVDADPFDSIALAQRIFRAARELRPDADEDESPTGHASEHPDSLAVDVVSLGVSSKNEEEKLPERSGERQAAPPVDHRERRGGSTRGVIYLHACPPAVCPHAEWAISGVLGVRVSLDWSPQPAAPGQVWGECSWAGPAGSGGAIAGALRAWSMLRFEVTEDPGPGVDGERFAHVPGLGMWRGRTSANGDIVLSEDQIRAVMADSPGGQVHRRLDQLLGTAWDDDLESFRIAREYVEPVVDLAARLKKVQQGGGQPC